MADRRAVNKWTPYDFDPTKGSANTQLGQHHLRKRASKLKEGILVVRFEMPFNVFCGGCEKPIGRGVRFNAKKKKVGAYYSTPILSFSMTCPECRAQEIVIETDPKNAAYVVRSGALQRVDDGGGGFGGGDGATDDALEQGLVLTRNDEEREALAADPFAALEARTADERKATENVDRLEVLEAARDAVWRDDYAASRAARSQARTVRKVDERALLDGARRGLAMPLLPETRADADAAAAQTFVRAPRAIEKQIEHSSIFSSSSGGGSSSGAKRKSTLASRVAEAARKKRQRPDSKSALAIADAWSARK